MSALLTFRFHKVKNALFKVFSIEKQKKTLYSALYCFIFSLF